MKNAKRTRLPASLTALLLLTLLLGTWWAFATPPPINGTELGERWGNFHPDEGSHVSVILYMAAHPFSLPPYEKPFDTSVHPPLYHGLAAAVFAAANRFLSPLNALRAVRLLSVLFGVGTVYFAYRAARQTRLARAAAFPAACLVALIPMRLSLSGGTTNENLVALGVAAALALLYENIRFGFRGRRFAWLVFWCVVAIGSKITAAGLILSVGVGLLYALAWRTQRFGAAVARFASLMGAVLLALGWWFVYNTIHFGDPVRKAAADRLWDVVQPGYAVLGVRNGFAPWRYFLSLLVRGWISFWGTFDGMSRPLPLPAYVSFGATQLAAFIGTGIALARILPKSRTERAICTTTGVFAAWVLLVYVQYNWQHYTPQGRYFFVLLAPFGVFIAGGVQAVIRRFAPRMQTIIYLTLGVLLLLLNLYTLWVIPRRAPW